MDDFQKIKRRRAGTGPIVSLVQIQRLRRFCRKIRSRYTARKTSLGSRLHQVCEGYFDIHMWLFPFAATLYGRAELAAQFGNNLSDAYRDSKKLVANCTLAALVEIEAASLQLPPASPGTYSASPAAPSPSSPALSRELSFSGSAFYRAKPLTNAQWISLGALRVECENDLAESAFPSHLLPLEQMSGIHLTFSMMGTGDLVPFENEQEFLNWFRKCKGWPVWVDTAIARMREGIEQHVTLPKSIVRALLPQLVEFCVAEPTNPFYGPMEKLAEDLEPHRAHLQGHLDEVVTTLIAPSFAKLHKFLEEEYLPQARETVGLCGLPNGQQWYQAAVNRHLTTSQWSTDAIFALGHSEMARIREKLQVLQKAIGFEGELRDFMLHMANPLYHFSSGEEALSAFRTAYEAIELKLPKLFKALPKVRADIKQVEQFRAESAAGALYEPAVAGNGPGTFYINVHDLTTCPKWSVETTTLHEAIPGHHLQLTIAQQLPGLPSFQKYGSYTAYDEGWALYCESLGHELGLFEDPLQLFGRLHDEMLRAMRLVVDVGIHAKGWAQPEAVDFMLRHCSMPQSAVEAEVERYISLPGQALAYKLGEITIRSLRDSAAKALGPSFDVREFHTVCLSSGSIPLAVLRTKVEKWVETVRSKEAPVQFVPEDGIPKPRDAGCFCM
eukprot:TRINITY_DN10270_c0_g1_i1.p1 TRINITY_DN10270_c0_g1~~TRINITY_DN10270_c0_g1_i1.p1  ORF type:complete len:686 (+),score=106.67 TRINITY_DN10270_c0_g1_i1:49-2058(+)